MTRDTLKPIADRVRARYADQAKRLTLKVAANMPSFLGADGEGHNGGRVDGQMYHHYIGRIVASCESARMSDEEAALVAVALFGRASA